MNNSIKRHPRTLQEDFGPYTDNLVYTKEELQEWHDESGLSTIRWCFVGFIYFAVAILIFVVI